MIRGLALLAAIGALSVLLAWELSPTEGNTEPLPARVTATAPRAGAPPRAGADDLAEVVAGMIARPLFSPDRRPPGQVKVQTAPEVADLSRPPRLTGTIVGPDGGRAIFIAANGKPRTAAVGETIDAFTVQDIAPGAVTVMGPDGPRVLHPAYISPQPAPGLVRTPGSSR